MFEYTNGVVESRKSKTGRKYNGQEKDRQYNSQEKDRQYNDQEKRKTIHNSNDHTTYK